MLAGNNNIATPDIIRLGFCITNKIELLGITIDADLDMLGTVHSKTIRNLTHVANFWTSLRLSLSGRINIAKTFMYSQIGYIGCIITPTIEQMKSMEKIIHKFVSANLNLGYERMFQPPSYGGIGMFKVDEYIKSLQVAWVKKASHSTRDNWRVDLTLLGQGNALTLTSAKVDKERYPIIGNIAKSWDYFKSKFWTSNDNYKKALIFNNPMFKRSIHDQGFLDSNFFTQNPPIDLNRLTGVRFCNIMTENGIKMLYEINDTLNLNINILTYVRLNTALNQFKNRLGNNRKTDNTSRDLSLFLGGIKKG